MCGPSQDAVLWLYSSHTHAYMRAASGVSHQGLPRRPAEARSPVFRVPQQLTEEWRRGKGCPRMGTESETQPGVRKDAAQGGPGGWR